jgi:hypothetical protein
LEPASSAVKGDHFATDPKRLQYLKKFVTKFNLFSDCSPCKRKFDDCPIVDEKQSEVIRDANGSNGSDEKTDGSAHLWLHVFKSKI